MSNIPVSLDNLKTLNLGGGGTSTPIFQPGVSLPTQIAFFDGAFVSSTRANVKQYRIYNKSSISSIFSTSSNNLFLQSSGLYTMVLSTEGFASSHIITNLPNFFVLCFSSSYNAAEYSISVTFTPVKIHTEFNSSSYKYFIEPETFTYLFYNPINSNAKVSIFCAKQSAIGCLNYPSAFTGYIYKLE